MSKEKIEILAKINPKGDTILHAKINEPAFIWQALSKLPFADMLDALITENNQYQTVLHMAAAHYPATLAQILKMLHEDERLELLQFVDGFHNTALYYTLSKTECFDVALSFLSDKDQLTAIFETNEKNSSALSASVENLSGTLNRMLRRLSLENAWIILHTNIYFPSLESNSTLAEILINQFATMKYALRGTIFFNYFHILSMLNEEGKSNALIFFSASHAQGAKFLFKTLLSLHQINEMRLNLRDYILNNKNNMVCKKLGDILRSNLYENEQTLISLEEFAEWNEVPPIEFIPGNCIIL